MQLEKLYNFVSDTKKSSPQKIFPRAVWEQRALASGVVPSEAVEEQWETNEAAGAGETREVKRLAGRADEAGQKTAQAAQEEQEAGRRRKRREKRHKAVRKEISIMCTRSYFKRINF